MTIYGVNNKFKLFKLSRRDRRWFNRDDMTVTLLIFLNLAYNVDASICSSTAMQAWAKIESSWHTDQEPQISEDNLVKSQSSTHPNPVSVRFTQGCGFSKGSHHTYDIRRHLNPMVVAFGVESVTCITKLQTI
jgi:hypothetical protein